MKWFKEEEFNKVKKLIDDGAGAKAIGDWYWADFKNNATTLAMAYFYAILNGKCPKCTTKLETLLVPKGKTGPLEFNDVVSEMWNHDPMKAIKNINILLDNDIPFQVKSGDVAYELMTNPQLTKAAEAIKTNPDIISKYMKGEEKSKIEKALLASDDYEMVVKGMDSHLWKAQNTKVRAYSKSENDALLKRTLYIKNVNHRKRYIEENVLVGDRTFERLFNTLLEHYEHGTWNAQELVDVMSKLGYKNAGNGNATLLLYQLTKEGKQDIVRKIVDGFEGNLFGGIFMDFRTRPWSGDKKLFGPELELDWILDNYSDLVEVNLVIEMVGREDNEEIVSKFLDKYPDDAAAFGEKYPDKMPQAIKDMFIF
jgi:hypothetical protein